MERWRASLLTSQSPPEDVANLVAWLLSDEAQWICGQTIDSEGGFIR